MDYYRLNKRLLKGFLANAKALLKKDDGEIHVTQKGELLPALKLTERFQMYLFGRLTFTDPLCERGKI